ncbi:hypothetical protein CK203_041870 [Vitis vinifera]|uniref:Uncharacterized protein n=1 Tax=Vitis vinifera TaxID=29760 RepID=A0A438FYG0_VITVI|nr:hypothetical protein CK203_041870 [Vitis vinifera]
MLVPRTIPICAMWIDDLMKKMVHVELQDYGDFGLVDVQENEMGEDAHEDPVNPVNEVEEETTNIGHPPIRSYRLHRHATAIQSPYVVQPPIKFLASSSVAKQVLAYALDNTRDESQILCFMYDFFLTRFNFKCLGPDKLVDSKVVTMHCRILNGMDKENRKHFLSPNFVSDVENKRGTLSPKYMCDNL